MNTSCQNCKKDFVISNDDQAFYEQIKVPTPTWCPLCRLGRRMIWRNERTLYKRNCDLCQKPSIGMYHPEIPLVVYCRDCWYSDKWDALSYGQEYDFSKPFFEQWRNLMQKVPRCSLAGSKNVNSDYANFSLGNGNSYLCFASHYNEYSAYLQYSNKCKNSFDCLHVGNSERVIDCNYCDHLNNCASLQYANSCTDCILGYDLHNCMNCFGCVGLRGKSYMIFNVQYDRTEYQAKVNLFLKDKQSYQEAKKEYEKLQKAFPRRGTYQQKCIGSTGSDLEECKNVIDSFGVKYSEDCHYLFVNCVHAKSSMDMNNIAYDPSEFVYEAQGVTGSSNVKFIDTSWDNTFVEYSNLCFSSKNAFGSIGLRKKEYCILNKQYSKEAYEELLPKVITHMKEMPFTDTKGRVYSYGEFFPPSFSPFYYNETTSAVYFPLTKEEIIAKGYHFREPIERNYSPTQTESTLPREPDLYTLELANEIIECTHKGTCADQCTQAFRLLPDEISLYKTLRIPLPIECPNCRNMSRVNARGGMTLRSVRCMCRKTNHEHLPLCDKEMLTNFPASSDELFFCDQCYQQEVV